MRTKNTFNLVLARAAITLLAAVLSTAATWAQTEVANEDQLRSAIVDGATINLRSNITLQNCLEIGSGVSVTIYMNGQTLSRSLNSASGNGNIFHVNGGSLTLSSSNSDHGKISGGWDNYGGAIEVSAGGTLQASDITFSGNKAAYDGGAIYNRGTAMLSSCTFTGNTADGKGGAIYNEGTLQLPNVTISECSAQYGGGIWNGGSNANLDGYYGQLSVTDCSASVAGGGIYSISNLDLGGNPIINGNTVNSKANNLYLDGSDIKIDASSIYDKSTHVGVTLSKYNRVFTSDYSRNNSAPDKYFYPDNSYASVKSEGGQAYMELLSVATESELNDAVEAGKENITLVDDIHLDKCLLIDGNKTVTIDLNGHDLGRGLSAPPTGGGDGHVIGVRAGSSLTINDGSSNNAGTISGGYAANGGGIYVNNGATITINGGKITGNTATDDGGGIYNLGTLTITDCTISGNKANGESGSAGGGIWNSSSSPLSLSNCTITGNQCSGNGGGVNIHGDATIIGCTITGNTAGNNGGGIYVDASGKTVAFSGSNSIKSNSASGKGGGLYTLSNVSMKDKIIINSNGSNVYLYGSGTKINVAGAFKKDTKIGVSVSDNNRVITSGYKTYNSEKPTTYFTCDNGANFVSLYNKEVLLTEDLNYAVNHYSVEASLTKSITLGSALVVDNNVSVTLYLNGYTLDRASTSRSDGSQVIYVKSGATLNISGGKGKIKGGWGGNGGGILNEGTLSIDKVTITGNTADDRGGGISNNGTLTMTDCTVSDNTSKDDQDPKGGGGIYNYQNATATLTNCTITGNTTEKSVGGGICNKGTLTIDGITVKNNTATNSYGDGIYSSNSFSMKGKCVVSGNSDSNVYLNGSDIKITVAGAFGDGTSIGVGVSDNNRQITSGYGTYHTDYPATYFSCDNGANFMSLYNNEALLTINLNEALYNFNGVKAVLTKNITLSSGLMLNNNMTATLVLNGYTIDRASTSRSDGSQVIYVKSGATLTLRNGTMKGGWGGDGGGILNEGTLDMTEVTITGCTASDRGGAVSNNGALTMTDCTVTGNKSTDDQDPKGGGGIFNYSGKTATLTRCTITGNTATTYGGGGICNYGTLTLTDCEVTDNSASKYHGGGIWNSGTLAIDGITVTGNTASGYDDVPGYGDGIYSKTDFSMKGKCIVSGNSDSNVYLDGTNTVITCNDGALDEGTSVGLGVSNYDRALTSGYSNFNSGTDPADFFSMDNGKYGIAEINGEAYPGITYYDHSWEGGNTDGHVVATRKVCTGFSYYNGETEITDGGWYVLSGTEEYGDRVKIHSDVKFILMDGSDSEFEKGIHIKQGCTLTIYGQGTGTGKLRATGDDGFDNNGDAAIGGNNNVMGGSLVIHGGTVTAKPDNNCAAGIGGGQSNESGMQSVVIWGGTVSAEGRSDAAGIGGGEANCGPTVTIYGGTVTAKGGSYGAGIGGGQDRSNSAVTIYGGTVNATGGSKAAGIGGGEDGTGGGVTIYGGNVTARGGKDGAGIGGGHKRGGGSIAIYGGSVKAEGNDGSYAIGSGDDYANSNSVTMTLGSTVCVKSNDTDLVACSQRMDIINSANKVTVEACSHSANPAYIDKNVYYHTATCNYCEGYDEAHTLGSDGNCPKCGRSLPERTITFYEANDFGTGYATTGTDYTVAELTDFTIPECTTVPGTMVFAGWELAASTPESLVVTNTERLLQAGDIIQLPIESTDRAYYARYTEYQFAGSGTEDDPYLVRSTDEWDRFAYAVNIEGKDFSGIYLRLTKSIKVTTMVGGQTGPGFSGTFDGDGWTIVVNYTGITEDRTAPFRYLIGATIKDLHVQGTIETSARYAAGIAAYVRGKTKIEGCRSSVTIRSSHAGFSGHGGIVALKANYTGAKPTIEGCLFDGKILTTNGSTFCGGIVGYTNGQTLTIKNCLVEPKTLSSGETRAGGSTLYNNSTDGQPTTTVIVNNCYYTEALGNAQGTQAYTVESGTDWMFLNFGEAITTYYCSMIDAYDFGLLFDEDLLCTGEEQSVTFNLDVVDGNKVATNVTASAGSLTANGDGSYTMMMPAENVTITATLSDTNNTLVLYDTPTGTTNYQKICEYAENWGDVILQGRTLYKDGSWNTLCLPFTVHTADINKEDHPLHGATIMRLNVSSYYDADGNYYYYGYEEGDETLYDKDGKPFEGDINTLRQTGFDAKTGTLYLYFYQESCIYSGYTYIVRWGTPDNNPGGTITNPKFSSVRIKDDIVECEESRDGKMRFEGIYDPVTFTGEDKTVLYLDSGNKLRHPGSGTSINAFRCYFQLDRGFGDVNGDDMISVTDVTMLVNHILGNQEEEIIIKNADITGDGTISVADVTELVNIILNVGNNLKVVVNGLEGVEF